MIPVLCVSILCLTLLAAQMAYHDHKTVMESGKSRIDELETRLSELERKSEQKYDHAAFEDLRGKVEGLRLAQGFKR